MTSWLARHFLERVAIAFAVAALGYEAYKTPRFNIQETLNTRKKGNKKKHTQTDKKTGQSLFNLAPD